MSKTDLKARVLLLDQNTGKAIGECDIISDSKEILYTNKDPMPESKGNIPAGTTFDKTPISDIIDGILYDKISPSFNDGLTFSNGDVINSTSNTIIIKPNGTIIPPFTVSITALYGSYNELTINLFRSVNGKKESTITKTCKRLDKNISSAVMSFEIPQFFQDTDIWFTITAGTDSVTSPMIQYKFVSPIWVGWIRSDIINNTGELDKEITEHYFQELIDHTSNNLKKRFVYKSNQSSYVVPGLNYDTREQLNPCIIIPKSWGELKKITDMNGNNIINSYAKYIGIDINTHEEYIEQYIAYVSRQTHPNDFELIRGVTYVTDNSSDDVNIDNFAGNGIPTNTGFTVYSNDPIDSRLWVHSYKNLLDITYPYPGLITYVEEINTTFRFEKKHWVPFNNKFHVVESINELTEDLGGWDDLAINATDKTIWKKRYNNQWERYGDIKAEDNQITFKPSKGDE